MEIINVTYSYKTIEVKFKNFEIEFNSIKEEMRTQMKENKTETRDIYIKFLNLQSSPCCYQNKQVQLTQVYCIKF